MVDGALSADASKSKVLFFSLRPQPETPCLVVLQHLTLQVLYGSLQENEVSFFGSPYHDDYIRSGYRGKDTHSSSVNKSLHIFQLECKCRHSCNLQHDSSDGRNAGRSAIKRGDVCVDGRRVPWMQ